MVKEDLQKQAADALEELERINDKLTQIDEELIDAIAMSESFENEDFTSPEEEADIARRVDLMQKKISQLQTQLAEHEDELSKAQDRWQYLDNLAAES